MCESHKELSHVEFERTKLGVVESVVAAALITRPLQYSIVLTAVVPRNKSKINHIVVGLRRTRKLISENKKIIFD